MSGGNMFLRKYRNPRATPVCVTEAGYTTDSKGPDFPEPHQIFIFTAAKILHELLEVFRDFTAEEI
jgi:hypothetical protein